jgi:hypothetical protein
VLVASSVLAGLWWSNPRPVPGKVVTRLEPLKVYPEAVEVRLLVHDAGWNADGERVFSHPQGQVLTPSQRAMLQVALRKRIVELRIPRGAYDTSADATGCFIPHHFFRYFDARGRQVGELAVCFCCGGTRLDPLVAPYALNSWPDVDLAALGKLIISMGERLDYECHPRIPREREERF